MGTVRDLEFIFHDTETNSTVVLHGELDTATLLTNNTKALLNTTTEAPQYDGAGALYYVISVIIVYSIAMFLIVATLLRRKSQNKSIDVEVDKYIKGLENARNQAKMESVLRTRLRWPGNYIGLRFSSRHPCSPDSTGKPLSDDSSLSLSDAGNEEFDLSYEELPATTIVYHSDSSDPEHSQYTEIEHPNLIRSGGPYITKGLHQEIVHANINSKQMESSDHQNENGQLKVHGVSRRRSEPCDKIKEIAIPVINLQTKSNTFNQKQGANRDHIAYTALDSEENEPFIDKEQQRIQEYQNKRRRSGAIPKLTEESVRNSQPLCQIDEHYV